MLKLAATMLRHRPGSAIATLIALAAGVMILMTMGTLVESGLRFRPPPQRYGAAEVVVAHRSITFTTKQLGDVETTTVPLPEGGTVPADLVTRIRAVPGVAEAVGDYTIPVVPLPGPEGGGAPVLGHGWGSAALAPYRISAGHEPGADNEIVADRRLGLRPGQPADLLVGGVTRHLRVAGVVEPVGPGPAVFFTDARAAELTGHPGRVDAVGVLAAPGADHRMVTAVGRLAAAAGAETYAGSDRGKALTSDDATAAALLTEIGAVFGGYVVLLIVFVVAGTVGLSVRHRRRDLALLRAVAATPGQVRRLIMAEAALLGLGGAAIGVPAALLTTGWVHGQVVARGFVPAGFPLAAGALAGPAAVAVTTTVAVLAALTAARRVTRIRPTEALGEVAVEPARSGPVRLGFGLATLAAAVAAGGVTVGARGDASLAGAVGMLYLFVLAVALLAPWINRTAARLLTPVLPGVSGHLAAANLRANAQGMATVLTALVLSVGFGGSVWFLQDNLERQTVAQSRAGMLADHALVSPAGLPPSAAAEIRWLPWVRAATGVRHTSVVVPVFDGAETVSAQAIDTDAAATMDLRVTAGSLADLHGASVAVSATRAATQGWHVGQQVTIRLGDGTPATLRVVAVYQRGLGFGDLTLTRATVGGLDDEVLIRADPGTAVSAMAGRYPGSSVVPAAALTGRLSADLALSAWLNKLLIGVMVGYAVLAAANTMVMAALARGRELAQLRLVGVTRRQARRMVTAEQAGLLGVALVIGGTIAAVVLTAVVHALTGDLVPYVPPLGWAAVIGGTTLLALVTTILPIGRLLHRPAIESIGLRE